MQRHLTMPSRDWKQRYRKQVWVRGDTFNTSIGQGFTLVTPIQMAVYVSAMLNGGDLLKPQLLEDAPREVRGRIPAELSHLRFVVQAMRRTAGGGTAKVVGRHDADMGGKTGTAEMFENGESFDNGLFIAFAPFDNPQIVICVVGEGAGHGAYVAPIVRDMLDEYFSVGKSDSAASRQAENTLIR